MNKFSARPFKTLVENSTWRIPPLNESSVDYESAEVLLTEWLQLAWSSHFESFHQVAQTAATVYAVL